MVKPSNLPFHLLAWGQQYIRVHNCYQFYPKPTPVGAQHRALSATEVAAKKPHSNGTVPLSTSTPAITTRSASNSTQRGGISAALLALFNPSYDPAVNTNLLPKDDGYDICWPSAIAQSHQGPLKPVYLKKFDVSRGRHRHNIGAAAESAAAIKDTKDGKATNAGPMIGPAIRYVYFTEADQTVHFDSLTTPSPPPPPGPAPPSIPGLWGGGANKPPARAIQETIWVTWIAGRTVVLRGIA
jgi:hypothetical protein